MSDLLEAKKEFTFNIGLFCQSQAPGMFFTQVAYKQSTQEKNIIPLRQL